MRFRLSPLSIVLRSITLSTFAAAPIAFADVETDQSNNNPNAVVLSTISIEAMDDGDPIKTYVDYKKANVTRNGLDKKDIPQTIDTIDVSKYKIYGSNDLSVMLQGTPGIDTSYDMRGDGISIRGFQADEGDIYRDGVRESGQVRRSTANVERIEILKGPASVLYGRSGGGGVINMVTKSANFESRSSFGGFVGSYNNVGGVFDINQALSNNWAIRLTGEKNDVNSFRDGIGANEEMVSPSVTFRSDDERLTWTGQYTYDKLHRTPDRGPSYDNLPKGTSIRMGFAQSGDYVEDELQNIRSDLKYEINEQWKLHWSLNYRDAKQNFDHFYGGTYCNLDGKTNAGVNCAASAKPGYISQTYFWQQTDNKTTSSSFDLQGNFYTGSIQHQLTTGFDYSKERREPILSNKNADGSVIYGYVNPLTGERESNRGAGRIDTSHTLYDSSNYGLFLQDLISITPEIKIMLGVRYDSYDSKATGKLKGSAADGQSQSVSDSTWSPNAGVVWQPNDDHSFYASYSRSFAPFGGRVTVNSVAPTTDLKLFDAEPQHSDQYEIGVKSDWLNKRLNTQFSIFDISKSNIRAYDEPTEQWNVVGEQQSRGAEFSFIGQAFKDVYIRGGYGYKDAKVKENKIKPSLEGNQLKNSSKNTGNLFVRYIATEQIYAEVGTTYVGSFYTNEDNLTKIPGWTRFDAAIGYKDNTWGATFAVNNLSNKEYWRSSSMPGTPRNYLFRINYFF